MLCRTLFTSMPYVERFAAREMDHGTATKFAFRLRKLREAVNVIDERRQAILKEFPKDEQAQERDAAWRGVLAEEVPSEQRPSVVGELQAVLAALRPKSEAAVAAEIAALIDTGLVSASDS